MISSELIIISLIFISLIIYLMLDGHDLGCNLLLAFTPKKYHKKNIAHHIPYWDANETWLVLGLILFIGCLPKLQNVFFSENYIILFIIIIFLNIRNISLYLYFTSLDQIYFIALYLSSLTLVISQGLVINKILFNNYYYLNTPILLIFMYKKLAINKQKIRHLNLLLYISSFLFIINTFNNHSLYYLFLLIIIILLNIYYPKKNLNYCYFLVLIINAIEYLNINMKEINNYLIDKQTQITVIKIAFLFIPIILLIYTITYLIYKKYRQQ